MFIAMTGGGGLLIAMNQKNKPRHRETVSGIFATLKSWRLIAMT
jgi:hypothetical protein